MNALSGETYVFAGVDGKYGVYALKELFELHKQGHKIKVPALLNERGNIGWVEVEDVVSFGKQSMKRIMLATSRLFVEVSEGAIISVYSKHLFRGSEEQIKLKFKLVNRLKVTKTTSRNDSLLLTTRIPLNLPEGNQEEWDFGFTLGYFIAEGSFKKRKRSFTKNSLGHLLAFAKQKRMTLEDYLKFTTDVIEIYLAIGQLDFERGYVDVVQKRFKFANPYKDKRSNGYQLRSSDLDLIHLIKNYIEGNDSHTKHIKNEAYNRTKKFLEGIMDGFLAGDGSYSKKGGGFQVEITTNYRLYNDLIFLSKALGYDTHINKGRFKKSSFHPSNNYYYLILSIFKNWHRRTAVGLVKEHIKKIEDVCEKEAFNLILKPIYTQDDKHVKFNHLYFTAFGIVVSDAVKTFAKLH